LALLFAVAAASLSLTFTVIVLQETWHSEMFQTVRPTGPPARTDVIRGANLGSWLVVEPWVTPSLFYPFLCDATKGCPEGKPPVIDMASLCERLGPNATGPYLKKHMDTWVTEATIARLAAAGLNLLRVPYGFWIFGDSATVCPGLSHISYLDDAVDWAEKHGIQLLLEIHGVANSANGMDHSGVSHKPPWARAWGRDSWQGNAWISDPYVGVTRAAIKAVAERYAKRSHVVLMGLVNEVLMADFPQCDGGCAVSAAELASYFESTWKEIGPLMPRNASRGQPAVRPVLDAGLLTGLATNADAWATEGPKMAANPTLKDGVVDFHMCAPRSRLT
jgi:hypothetical protein